ncbi:hypothetical protein JCM15765_04210 [Paradesulfitobacterium aromaticivorans]
MPTQIFITPPGGAINEIRAYDKCSTKSSTTDKAGSFSLTLPSFDKSLFDKYVLGSDVRIIQDDSVFRGWILNPVKRKKGQLNTVEISGMSYAARTQRIIVTETYTSQAISYIVKDLFLKYAPQYNLDSVVTCNKIISIKFFDVFLFDAVEQLAKLAGYDWFIDEPTPELIDASVLSAGWQEIVDIIPYNVPFPSENLYPSEALLPG